jgi:hypothetical protein
MAAGSADAGPVPPPRVTHGDDLGAVEATPGGAAGGATPGRAPIEATPAGAAVGATSGGAAGAVSWVYRQGEAVWVYRGPENAAPEDSAAQVARLLAAIRAEPPAGDLAARSAVPAAGSGFRWTWLLVGALTGLFVGVVLTYFLTRPVVRVDPTSLLGFGGVLVGLVGLRTSPLPRGDPARQIAAAFLVGLLIYTSAWFLIGDPALDALRPATVGVLAPLSHAVSLACVIVGIKWLYDALDTTIVDELGPFGTIFTGTIASTLAVVLYLRGTGQALASTDLDALVTTIVALLVSATAIALIGPLLVGRSARRLSRAALLVLCILLAITVVQFVADLTGSVTGALYGGTPNPTGVYQALAESTQGWLVLSLYELVVYLWGLAALVLPLGGPLVEPRAAVPAVEADVTVGDLILRWK